MNKNKAQSAIEFVIIVGAMFFIFVSFIGFIGVQMEEKTFQKKDVAVKEVGLTLQDEINLASKSSDGYSRSFKLPYTMLKYDYSIRINDNLIYINDSTQRHTIAIPIINVTGQPVVIGLNNITKRNGTILLNS